MGFKNAQEWSEALYWSKQLLIRLENVSNMGHSVCSYNPDISIAIKGCGS